MHIEKHFLDTIPALWAIETGRNTIRLYPWNWLLRGDVVDLMVLEINVCKLRPSEYVADLYVVGDLIAHSPDEINDDGGVLAGQADGITVQEAYLNLVGQFGNMLTAPASEVKKAETAEKPRLRWGERVTSVSEIERSHP